MAKYNLDKYTSADGLGFPLNFRRGNPNPLDNSSVWASLEAAQNYAANDPVAYVGQILTVVITAEDGTTSVKAYSIQDEAGTLKEVGSVPVGDGLTIEVIDGQIKLKGAADAEVGAQPRIKDDGSIEWIVPSTETVDGLQTTVAELQSDVSTLQTDVDAVEAVVGNAEGGLVKDVADNAANISAINTKIGTVTDSKTVVEMISDAQAAATYDDTQVKADIKANADAIDILNDSSTVEGSIDYKIAQAVAAIMENPDETMNSINELVTWINNHAQDALELSNKVTANEEDIAALESLVGTTAVATQITDAIAAALKIDDVDKYALATDLTAAIARIAAMEAKVATWDAAEQNAKDYADGLNTAMDTRVGALEAVDAEKNIINSVDETQFNVDTDRKLTLLDVEMSKVTGLSDTLDGKVDKVEGSRLMTDAEGTKLANIAEGAEVNVIESVDGAQFAIDDTKKLTLLDIAMSKVTGLDIALSGKVDKVEGYTLLSPTDKTKLDALVIGESGVEISGKVNAANVEGLGDWITTNRDAVDGLFDTTSADKLNAIEEGAQANVLEAVKINGTALEITDKAVNIPVATDTLLGLVMGSTAENKVAVVADGTMEVNSVNVNKLVQTDGEQLILNGGSSVG